MSVEQLEGLSVYDLYPEEAAQYYDDDLEVIRTGEPKLGIVEVLTTASGEKRWVRTDKIPYRTRRGDRRCHRLRGRHLRADARRGGPAVCARRARAARGRAHAGARRHGREAALGDGRAPASRGAGSPAAGGARPRAEAADGGGNGRPARPRDQSAAGSDRELRPRAGAVAEPSRVRRRSGPARDRPDPPGRRCAPQTWCNGFVRSCARTRPRGSSAIPGTWCGRRCV